MLQLIRNRCRPADPPAMGRFRAAFAGAGGLVALAALAAPSISIAQITYRSDCQVVETTRLENFGHEGRPAQLSHFTCRIKGGPLHGSFVTGTNIWDVSDGAGGMLLGSIAIAQRAGSNVMYEVHDVSRRPQTREGRVVGWEATSWGIYKSATGTAAALAGKTFTSVVHYTGPRTFIIENIVNED